nr:hypothetical protein [Tanacetum cinerariifolium]
MGGAKLSKRGQSYEQKITFEWPVKLHFLYLASVQNISEVHEDGEIVLTVLADQTHVLKAVLKSKTAVHYYSFTSVRGQDVIVTGVPETSGASFWILEYFDGVRWLEKPESEEKFSSLMPGTEVLVKVSHRQDVSFSGRPYHLAIGSYPVLKEFKFSDELGVNRIPSGHTEPSWIETQGYAQGILTARFTDSVGAPLKGAVGRFVLCLKASRIRPVVEHVTTDEQGVATKVVNFDRCAGGHEAQDYVRDLIFPRLLHVVAFQYSSIVNQAGQVFNFQLVAGGAKIPAEQWHHYVQRDGEADGQRHAAQHDRQNQRQCPHQQNVKRQRVRQVGFEAQQQFVGQRLLRIAHEILKAHLAHHVPGLDVVIGDKDDAHQQGQQEDVRNVQHPGAPQNAQAGHDVTVALRHATVGEDGGRQLREGVIRHVIPKNEDQRQPAKEIDPVVASVRHDGCLAEHCVQPVAARGRQLATQSQLGKPVSQVYFLQRMRRQAVDARQQQRHQTA